MIIGKFNIEVEFPVTLPDGPSIITANGDFRVNSREELIDYLTQGVDAIEAEANRRMEEEFPLITINGDEQVD